MRKTGLCAILLSLIATIGLCSCTTKIPDGEIKNFVDKIDFDRAYEHVSYGKSSLTATHYIDGEEDGKIEIITYMDKSQAKYHLMTTKLSGSYHGTGMDQFDYYSQDVLCYINASNNVEVFKKTDGVLEDISYTPEDVDTSIKNFFYSKVDAGYHSGGVYYGDYILSNCGKYYNFFSLNEEKTELTFSINSVSKGTNDKEIITMHHFTVDEYGMVLSLTTKSFYTETPETYMETTMICDYVSPIDKIWSL